MTPALDLTGERLNFRYDGLDADNHVVEIGDLAASLRGLGRILTVAGTFVANQQLVERSRLRPVRVLVGPPQDGCVIISAALAWVEQHSFVSGFGSGLMVNLVSFIVAKAAGQNEEMKHLSASLETAIKELGHRDDKVVQELIATINRMADVLKPAVKQAVVPIGRSVGTLKVSDAVAASQGVTIDKAMRDAIFSTDPPQIGAEEEIEATFVEMNLDSRSCRILVGDDERRIAAEITDPEFIIPNSAYATAFAAKTRLTVRAKPTLRGGEVERWYISAHF